MIFLYSPVVSCKMFRMHFNDFPILDLCIQIQSCWYTHDGRTRRTPNSIINSTFHYPITIRWEFSEPLDWMAHGWLFLNACMCASAKWVCECVCDEAANENFVDDGGKWRFFHAKNYEVARVMACGKQQHCMSLLDLNQCAFNIFNQKL